MSEHEPATAQAERRLHQRFPIQVPVKLQPLDSFAEIASHTSNLSLHGCSVLLDNQFPVGQRIRIELSLGEEIVIIRGRVITRHPQLGNGIMFLKVEGNGQERLRRFLKALQGDSTPKR